MFEVGSYVVHSGHGVCLIKEIISNDKSYFKLQTVHNGMTIMMPCENAKVFLRPILSKNEIKTSIDKISLNKDTYVKDNKERKLYFQSLVTSNDICNTLLLIKLLYQLVEDKKKEKKNLGSFDSQFLQQAEKKLFYEMAIASGQTKDECKDYIHRIFALQQAL